MTILKKTISAALAAALSLTALTAVGADDAETKGPEYKLLYAEMAPDFNVNCYENGLTINDGRIIDFTEDDLKKWRETGEISYTELEFAPGVSDDYELVYDGVGDYVAYISYSEEEPHSYLLRYDREAKKLDVVLDKTQSNSMVFCNGAMLTDLRLDKESDIKKLIIDMTCADGSKKEVVLECDSDTFNQYYSCHMLGNEIFYINFKTRDGHHEVYSVQFDGTLQTLDTIEMDEKEFEARYTDGTLKLGLSDMYFDGAVWSDLSVPGREITKIWSRSDNSMHYIWTYGDKYFSDGSLGTNEDGSPAFVSAVNSIYNGKAAVKFSTGKYILVEAADSIEALEAENVKVLSDIYNGMISYDGETYIVVMPDWRFTYCDANGKLLAEFDDASDFLGDHALAVKDGKAFLVDRQMNRVSDEIDGEGAAVAVGSGVFIVSNGDRKYAVTYVKNTPESVPESAPESTPDESEPSAPATGVNNSLIVFIAAVSAAAAVTLGIISRKKR